MLIVFALCLLSISTFLLEQLKTNVIFPRDIKKFLIVHKKLEQKNMYTKSSDYYYNRMCWWH